MVTHLQINICVRSMLSLPNLNKPLLGGQMVQGEQKCWLWLPTSILCASLWHAILAHFCPFELTHLCAICSKDPFLMRFTSFIPVFGILLAITGYTPAGHSQYQMNSHVASHLSSKHLTVPFQCGSMMENLIDESVHSWRVRAVF